MTRPAPDAAVPDVLAVEYDPAPDLRRVFAMHSASPPEGNDDGDRSPAINRVIASLAGGYCSTDLDVRDVRCLVVAFADAEGIIDALNSQLSSARADLARLRAPADLAAIGARAAAASPRAVAYSYEGTTRGDSPRHQYSICNGTWQDEDTRPHKCIAMVYSDTEEDTADVVFFVNARHDVMSLLALLAAEREGRAAEVAGARAAALREAEAAVLARIVDHDGRNESAGTLPSVYARIIVEDCARAVAALGAKGGA